MDKKSGICPIMSFRTSFSKEAAVPCVQDKCAFWDMTYDKCGQVSQAERITDAIEYLRNELHSLVIKS